ncbi:DUF7313 family protein [Halospeciosus flavus]|uniref:DUF7313 domain-containing protein n=1 Tax=Halospeciosus flavus TaxID=3032283 RepID=A0ABD5Z510_9EURY|nr:hypothetical protein [Halospeciosus flavus]
MIDQSVAIFGPLDRVVGPYAGYVVLAFAVLTFLTRKLQHDHVVEQAASADDVEQASRHPVHSVALGGFVVTSFYYLTLHHHSGIVMATLAVGVFLTDFFEIEARSVEIREGHDLERPKAAMVAGVIALLYASYITLFVFVKDYWNMVV